MSAAHCGADEENPLDVGTEQARLAALNSYAVLDPLAVEVLSRLSGEAAASLAATQASVSFVDASQVWFSGAFGLNRIQSPRENSYCDTVVRSAAPLLVPDGLADPRFQQHELVCGEPGLRCYAGAPLIDHDGFTLGAVAVYSVEPAAFSTGILHDLSALAAMVRDFLAEARGTPASVQAARPQPGPTRRVQGWLGVKTLSTEEGKDGTVAGLVVLSVAKGSPAPNGGPTPDRHPAHDRRPGLVLVVRRGGGNGRACRRQRRADPVPTVRRMASERRRGQVQAPAYHGAVISRIDGSAGSRSMVKR